MSDLYGVSSASLICHHSVLYGVTSQFDVNDITNGGSGLKQRDKGMKIKELELDHLSLPLLLSSQLEVFGPLDGHLVLPLADRALHPEDQLLGGLGLLPQNRLPM